MRVALDATPLLGNPTGVGVVTRAFAAGLAARDDVELVGYALTWRGRGDLSHTLPQGAAPATRRVRGRSIAVPMAARPLREVWSRTSQVPIEWWTGPVDVVHGPNFLVPPARHAARLSTVHDLTFLRFPELCTADTLAFPPLLRRAVREGAWIQAVSDFVAGEVIEELGAPPERVVVVPNGGPAERRRGDPANGRRLAASPRYLLALGTVEPRKDLPGLVQAYAQLHAEHPDLTLVIAGSDGWGAQALSDAIHDLPAAIRYRIRRLGWVSDADRADLLAGAAVYVFPSLYEGFGLPPLEAMAEGTPVVTTEAGALPEVVGDAALLVPPRDTAALAEAIGSVLTDDGLAATLRARGDRNLDRFDWGRSVDQLVDVYRKMTVS